jgi:hypothetical protein
MQAGNFSAGVLVDTPCPKVYYYGQKKSPSVLTRSQLNSVHTIRTYFVRIIGLFSCHLPKFLKWSYLFRCFAPKMLFAYLISPICAICLGRYILQDLITLVIFGGEYTFGSCILFHIWFHQQSVCVCLCARPHTHCTLQFYNIFRNFGHRQLLHMHLRHTSSISSCIGQCFRVGVFCFSHLFISAVPLSSS